MTKCFMTIRMEPTEDIPPNAGGWVYAALCHWANAHGGVQVVKHGFNIYLYQNTDRTQSDGESLGT